MQPLRTFNQQGINRFREFLRELRVSPKTPVPVGILNDYELTREISAEIVLDSAEFKSPMEAIEYLSSKLHPINRKGIYYDAELWSWLSCYYFDLVCPITEAGRSPGRDYRHIPDKSFRYRHRHLLAGKMQVYEMHRDKARFMLAVPLSSESKIYHELSARQNLISNPSIVELADILYFDSKKGVLKKGVQTSGKPGSILRFVSIMQQLDLTYDLYSMSPMEIQALLPAEFKEWMG